MATYPPIKLALRLILLTLVRKGELIQATWDEVNFENATWTIPKQRMKGRNPHVVYLSRQAKIGFNRDWIEKCLAHEEGRSSRSVYNKAEYAGQRRHMQQEWAHLVDAWGGGQAYVPKLMPENVTVPALSAIV